MDKTINADVLLYVTERIVGALTAQTEAIKALTETLQSVDATIDCLDGTMADLEAAAGRLAPARYRP